MKAPRISIEIFGGKAIRHDDLNVSGVGFSSVMRRMRLQVKDNGNTWMKNQHNVMVF